MAIMRAEFPELAQTYEPEPAPEPDSEDAAEASPGGTA